MKKIMCQSNITQVWRPVSVCLSVLLGVAMGLLPAQRAHGQACSTGLGASIDRDFPVAHVNDIITVTKVKVFTSLGDCTVTNGKTWLILPDNTSTQLMNGFSFTEGGSAECTGPASGSPCLPINYMYQIKATDVNTPLSFMTPNSNVCNHAATPKFIFFLATAEANAVSTSPDIPQACNNKGVQIVTPCIQVVKQCAYPAGTNCFAAGANINFTGYVTNCGDIQLSATVVDSRVLLGAGLTDLSGFPLLQPLTLAPNGFVAFKGSFTPTLAETCAGHAANTITVRGTDNTAIGGPNASVTNQTTVSCDICVHPCLTVTKQCATVVQGQQQTVSGVVANCGDIALTNIVISDDQYGSITTIDFLAAGASTNYSKTFTATRCGFTTNIVTAAGSTACGASVPPAHATNTCEVICLPPCIDVIKEVACLVSSNDCGTFGYIATGMKVGTNIPGFCYSIVVSNCGLAPLTNVQVIDDKLGDLTLSYFPGGPGTVFDVGHSLTNFYKAAWGADTTNTVTGTGQSAITGETTSDQTNAVALVLPAGIECIKLAQSPDDLDGNPNDNHVTLPSDGQPHHVLYSVIVTNTDKANLANITINDPTLFSNPNCQPPAPFALAAGAATTIALCAEDITCAASDSSCGGNFPGCVSLGQARGYAVFAIGGTNVTISAPATVIDGDVALGPNGSGSVLLKAKITGALYVDPTTTFKLHDDVKILGGIISRDLTQARADALSASACAAALPPTQIFGDITTSTTITGNGGVNVIRVHSVDMVKKTLTFVGGPSDIFILNVAGKFNFASSQMVLSGGVTAANILWNFPGPGLPINIFKEVTVADGTFLAPQRGYIQDHAVLNGSVIVGRDIHIHSGAFVVCPPGGHTPPTINTITVTGEADTAGVLGNPQCGKDLNGNKITVSSQCSATVECQ